MGRGSNLLTAKFVQNAKAPGRHSDGAGLYLYVDASGSRRWVFMFTLASKRREMGLGSADLVGLADARVKALAARRLVDRGIDPITERQKPPPAPPVAANTFGVEAKALIKDLQSGWKSAKTPGQWEASLKTHAAAIWDKPVDRIDTEAVLSVLRPIWTTRSETASRVRGRIEHVLDAARVKGQIVGPWENPARWRGHLARLLPKRRTLTRGHHPAMPYVECPAFIESLKAREAMAAAALEFCILTAGRENEILGAVVREFALDAGLWTVPSKRMKSGREHRVALSARAVEIVRETIQATGAGPGDLVFPGQKRGRPLSNMAMDMLLRRMGLKHVTVHGFRSSFKDWAEDCTDFSNGVIEAALAHLVGDKVERAYRRGDALEKRRELMEAWAKFLATPVGSNVVDLGGAREMAG